MPARGREAAVEGPAYAAEPFDAGVQLLEEEDGVEVDVLQPFGVGGDAGDETLEVRALRDRACEDEGGSGMSQWGTHPGACCLVHVFKTYVC